MNYIHYGSIELIHKQRLQDVMRANQLRQARGNKPHGMIIVLNNVRNVVASLLISAGERVRQEPVRRSELDAKPIEATRQA